VEGNEASVKSLPRKSIQDFFSRYYRPNRTIIAVVGDVSEQEISQALERALHGWNKGVASTPPPAPAKIGAPQSLQVKKDLTQANIILGHDGVPRDHPDYYAIQVMNYILGGGGFSSRAMDSIRNERGLAYSVYSYFSAEKSHGSYGGDWPGARGNSPHARARSERSGTQRREKLPDGKFSAALRYQSQSCRILGAGGVF
jgi:zinc protease